MATLVFWGPGLPQTAGHGDGSHTGFTVTLGGNPVAPVGIAATPARLLVTVCDGGQIKILSLPVDAGGFAAATVFATIPGPCQEPDIAIAPATPGLTGIRSFPSQNAAGYTSNHAFVTKPTPAGLEIWRVTHDGVVGPAPFVMLPACVGPTDYGHIAFSRVIPASNKPSFGPHGTMLVSCTNGLVWTVRPTTPGGASGTAAQVGALGRMIAGPDVAPLTFDRDGSAYFGAEGESRVYSLTPRGQVRRVASWPMANGVDFVPAPKCDYLTSQGTYFAIVGSAPVQMIWKFSQAEFQNLGGVAGIVTRGPGAAGADGLGLLTSARGGQISPFHPFQGDGFRGAAFAHCDPTLIRIDVEPQSATTNISWGSNGLVTVLIFGSATFDVGTIVTSSLTFGWTGDEPSLNHCTEGKKDYDNDGFSDVECKFRIAQLGVPVAEQQPGVKLILKGAYLAPTGDPPMEGSD